VHKKVVSGASSVVALWQSAQLSGAIMPHRLQQLLYQETGEGESMNPANCDKGPVLDQIQRYIGELQRSQERSQQTQDKMSESLIQIAAQNERIIALAEKTGKNEHDINNLYKYQRDTDKRITEHILSPGHTAAGIPFNGVTTDKAEKWDKLQVSIVTAALLGAAGTIWKFVQVVLNQLNHLNGGSP